MTDEKKKEFQRRITSANRGEMIVVIYDIFFAHIEDAKDALSSCDDAAFKSAVRRADAVLCELQETLDFAHELARTLFPMYQYVREQLSLSLIKHDDSGIKEAVHHMEKLYQAFTRVASDDKSAPMMQNAESITVGMTYGRGTLNEVMDTPSNRGFLA